MLRLHAFARINDHFLSSRSDFPTSHAVGSHRLPRCQVQTLEADICAVTLGQIREPQHEALRRMTSFLSFRLVADHQGKHGGPHETEPPALLQG